MANPHRICSVEGCDKRSQKRGWCIAHYKRWERYGDPSAGGLPRGTLMAWLRANIDYSGDDCLFWPFGKKDGGRGSIQFRGRSYSASRVMCILAHGEPADVKLEAAHSCGNGHLACCNPRHLRWATKVGNMADAIAHGTIARGVSAGVIKANRARSALHQALYRAWGCSRETVFSQHDNDLRHSARAKMAVAEGLEHTGVALGKVRKPSDPIAGA